MNHFQNVNDWWNPTGEMRALFEYNITRVEFMKTIVKQQNFLNANENPKFLYEPFKNFKILDVGCGGGLLSESLARLGADIKGLDACENSISIAKSHQKLDAQKLSNLTYQLETVENLLEKEGPNSYDMITSMEVIEHVQDKHTFLHSISKLLKPDGLLFLSTMAKTKQSYMELIVGAEYVLNLVAKGTHDWNKFIDADDLSIMLQNMGIQTVELQGVNYDFMNNQMNLSNSLNTTYMYAGRKKI